MNYEYELIDRKRNFCSNCGRSGHEFKSCRDPITSFGIINIKFTDENGEKDNLKKKFSSNKNTGYCVSSKKYQDIFYYVSDNVRSYDYHSTYRLNNNSFPFDDSYMQKFLYYRNRIMFMMVSRKFSLGFVEFIRGKYDVSDVHAIISLFEQMTKEEINMISENSYDNLLYLFLGKNDESKESILNKIYEGKYSYEYCESKIKFNMLSNPMDNENCHIPWDLKFYTTYIKPRWKKPEWGFPKGRRNKKSEENINCACREFEEETGYNKDQYTILNKIEPIEENMVGTNGVTYRHIYYLAISNTDPDNSYDTFEIGSVKWFTYTEAMNNIRPYHTEKKRILTQIYLFLLNYLICYDNMN